MPETTKHTLLIRAILNKAKILYPIDSTLSSTRWETLIFYILQKYALDFKRLYFLPTLFIPMKWVLMTNL